MQGTQVPSQVRKDPTCHGELSQWATTTEPVLRSPGSATTEPVCHNYWSPCALEPELCQQEKPLQQRVWYNLSIYSSVHLFTYLSVYPSVHLSVYSSIHLFTYLSIYLSDHLSVYLSRACLVLVLSHVWLFVTQGLELCDFSGGSDGKESVCNMDCNRPGFDPWVGKIPWRRKWQYSCLENPMDRGTWRATVHGIAKSQTQLSDKHSTAQDYSLLGSSLQGIFQARILEWVAICYSRGSSWPRDQTCNSCVSCIGRQILYY